MLSRNILLAVLFLGIFSCALIAQEANEPNYMDWSKSDNQFRTMEDDSSLLGKLFGSIIVILILGWAAYYLTKKLGLKTSPVAGKYIEVLETVNIGSQKQLHMIRSGDKQILISSTAQNITKISEMDVKTDNQNEQ